MTKAGLPGLYSDDLLSAFGETTARGRSALWEGQVTPDKIQRFLAGSQQTSAVLCRIVLSHGCKIEQKDAGMIVDDSNAEKPCTVHRSERQRLLAL